MTSHDVIRTIRRLTHQKRVGHAGTLDPCAKGVLVVAISRAATKTLKLVVGTDKEYLTRIKLGWRSTTDDREGRIEPATFPSIPSEAQVRQALAGFQGVIDQRPPAFSAIKVNGRAAYKLARAAKDVDLPARKVEAKEIDLLAYAWPYVDVRLVTGPGFYVRSLARDLGEILGTGGYTEALERTRVGPYTKEKAIRLADWPRDPEPPCPAPLNQKP